MKRHGDRPGELVRFAAADRRGGLTLGELRKVLALADRVELPNHSRVTVDIGWRSQLQQIEIHRAVGGPDPETKGDDE